MSRKKRNGKRIYINIEIYVNPEKVDKKVSLSQKLTLISSIITFIGTIIAFIVKLIG